MSALVARGQGKGKAKEIHYNKNRTPDSSHFGFHLSKGVKNPKVPKFKGRDEKFNFVFLKDAIVRESEDTLRFSISKQLKKYLNEKYKIKNIM